jgi:uncharacterized membrane protein
MSPGMQGIANAFSAGLWSIVLPLAITGILIGSFVGFIILFLRKRYKD